jgi:hypothetical protein
MVGWMMLRRASRGFSLLHLKLNQALSRKLRRMLPMKLHQSLHQTRIRRPVPHQNLLRWKFLQTLYPKRNLSHQLQEFPPPNRQQLPHPNLLRVLPLESYQNLSPTNQNPFLIRWIFPGILLTMCQLHTCTSVCEI